MAQQPQQQGFGSFGSFLGLPKGVDTRGEMLRNKKLQEMNKFKEEMARSAQNVAPEHRQVYEQFAQLGNIMGQKIGGGETQLTEEEGVAIDTMEAANKRFAQLQSEEGFAEKDPMEQGFARQRILYEELIGRGEVDNAMQVAQGMFTQQNQYRQAKAATDNLEQDTAQGDRDAQRDEAAFKADMTLLNEGRPVAVAEMVNGRPNLSQLTSVQMLPDGTYVDGNGDSVVPGKDFMLQSDALNWGKLYADQAAATADDAFTRESVVKETGIKGMEGLRKGLVDVKAMEGIVDEVANVYKMVQNPADVVGSTGGMNRAVSNLTRFVTGGAGVVGAYAEVGEDGKVSGEFSNLDDLAVKYVPLNLIPESIRDNARAASRYRAAIMQMVYVDARLEEPGARQLSDADIKNAMDRLGVNENDAVGVAQTFGASLDRRLATSATQYEYFQNRMSHTTGDLPSNMEKSLGVADPVGRITEARKRVGTAFGSAAATAAVAEGEAVPTDSQASPEDESRLSNLGF